MSDLAQRATLSDRAGSMYGYARTNRPDIDVEPQHRALREVGVREEAIFTDLVVSGLHMDGQTQLRTLLGVVRAGDTIVVDHLYRLGRDARRTGALLAELKHRDVMVSATDHVSSSLFARAGCAVGICEATGAHVPRARLRESTGGQRGMR
ncbi:recombinase family protein [Gulosibacter molinativorax]|nr:recombinase family protein [Gulosibacter molinativorax]QUY61511.1 Hypotetical protein [Gulosibacter molinativorax]